MYDSFIAAIRKISSEIEDITPTNIRLPRGYKIVTIKCRAKKRCGEIGSCDWEEQLYLKNSDGQYIDGINDTVCEYSEVYIPEPSMASAIKFAADINNGLLKEIAAFVEEINAELEKYLTDIS